MAKAKDSIETLRVKRAEAEAQIKFLMENSSKEECIDLLLVYFTTVDICLIRDQLQQSLGA